MGDSQLAIACKVLSRYPTDPFGRCLTPRLDMTRWSCYANRYTGWAKNASLIIITTALPIANQHNCIRN